MEKKDRIKDRKRYFIHRPGSGFTMVELLVVLAVLAVLAAIAIPVLMGYTDDAKEKNYIAEAKEALAASQTMLSDVYTNNLVFIPERMREEAWKTSGLGEDTEFTIYTVNSFEDADGTSGTIGSYTVASALYKSADGTYVYYDGTGFEIVDPDDDKVTKANEKANYIKVWKADMTDTAGDRKKTADADPDGNPIYDIIHEKEDRDDGNGEEISSEESSDPIILTTKLRLTLVGAEGVVTFGEEKAVQDIVEYDVKERTFDKEPEPTVDRWYDYQTLSWECDALSDDEEKSSIADIAIILGAKVKPGQTVSYTLTAKVDQKKVSIPVSFVAYNTQSLSVALESDKATDSNNDGVKDTILLSYGLVTKTILSDLSTVSVQPKTLPAADSGAITFSGKWGMKAGENYQMEGTSYKLLNNTESAVKSEVANWAKAIITDPGNTTQLREVEQGVSLVATADINKTVHVRGTLTPDDQPTGKVKFVKGTGASQTESYSFDVSYSNNELEPGEVYELSDNGGKKKVDLSEGSTYSMFTSQGVVAEYQPLHLKFMNLYDSHKNGELINDDSTDSFRDLDCSKEVVQELYSSTNYGEVAEIDVAAQTTKFVVSESVSGVNKTEVSNRMRSLGYSDGQIQEVRYILDANKASKSEIQKEVCLSVTTVKEDGEYLERDSAGKYVVNYMDPEYPAYTVAYTLKNNDGVVYVVTEDDSDIKAAGSLQGLFVDFTAMSETNLMNYVDTADVTSMKRMFYKCYELQSTINMKIDSVTSLESTFDEAHALTTVNLDAGTAGAKELSTVSSLFKNAYALTHVSFKNVNSDYLKSVQGLFSDKTALTSVDLTGFNTSQIENFQQMFKNCTSLNSITGPVTSQAIPAGSAATVAYFDIPSAKNISYMFEKAEKLTEAHLDGGSAQAPDLENVTGVFLNANDLTNISFTNIRSSKLKSVKSLFDGKKKLKKVDLTEFYTDEIEDFSYMFKYCHALDEVIGPHSAQQKTDTAKSAIYVDIPAAKDVRFMFEQANQLTGIYLDGGETRKASDMEYLYGVFRQAENLTHAALKNIDSDHALALRVVQASTDSNGLFDSRTKLKDVDMTGFNTEKVTVFSYMFKNCTALEHVYGMNSLPGSEPVANANEIYMNVASATEMQYMFENSTFTKIHLDASGGVEHPISSVQGLFNKCSDLKEVSILGKGRDSDTQLASVLQVFDNCPELRKVEIKGLKSSTLNTVGGLFKTKSKLQSVDFVSLSFPGIVSLNSMFDTCSSLQSISFSDVDTSTVTDMSRMFFGCVSLSSFGLNSLNTSNVTNMSYMFYDCRSIEKMNLSEFDTSKVTTMEGMFGNSNGAGLPDTKLTTLDISAFTTDSLTSIKGMFGGCTALKKIYVNPLQWRGDELPDPSNDEGKDVFTGCQVLSGSCGTNPATETGQSIPSSNPGVSSQYAIADEAAGKNLNGNDLSGEHGYFTAKIGTACFVNMTCLNSQNWSYKIFGKPIEKMTKFSRCTDENITEDNILSLHPEAKEIGDNTYSDPATDRTYKVYGWFDSTDAFYWWSEAAKVYIHKDTVGMFNFYYKAQANNKPTKLTEVDFQGVDTTQMLSFKRFFSDSEKLLKIYDGSKGSDVPYHFKSDIVTDMEAAFGSCKLLTDLDLTGVRTTHLTKLGEAFMDMASIKRLDLHTFSSELLTDCHALVHMRDNKYMIHNDSGSGKISDHTVLEEVIFGPEFRCRSVVTMEAMFKNCKNMKALDISSFDCSKTATYSANLSAKEMFMGCKGLEKIYATDPDDVTAAGCGFFANVNGRASRINNGGNMFNNCTSLVGGNGTKYDSKNNSSNYARIDKSGQMGYFTAK